MRVKCLFLCLGWIGSTVAMANCTLPCGVQELLDCAAARQPIPLASGEELYNQVLFQLGDAKNIRMLDGFCQLPKNQLPAGSLAYGLQQYYYYPPNPPPPPPVTPAGAGYCLNNDPENPYYSYAAFVHAAAEMATKAGESGVLACTGSVKDRYLELTAMLATFAQETTGGTSDVSGKCTYPCQGGMYWRYENGWLLGPNINYQTVYYSAAGKDQFFVAASQEPGTDISTQQTYTPDTWYGNSTDPTKNGGLLYTNSTSPLTISDYFTSTTSAILSTAPAGNNIPVQLTDPSVLYPGLWVGDGPTQLTAESLFFFYGWYQVNFMNNTQTANYYSFVNNYLTYGKLAFIGAYWYWMYRINGSGYWPIHTMMTNTDPNKQVCHGIAAATALVNGGCNNFSGRKSFYDYFAGILNPDPGGPNDISIPYTYDGMSSTDCTARLATYCQSATS